MESSVKVSQSHEKEGNLAICSNMDRPWENYVKNCAVLNNPTFFTILFQESEKVGLKLNIQKTKIMVSGPITSWEIDGKTVETVSDFKFFALQNHCIW